LLGAASFSDAEEDHRMAHSAASRIRRAANLEPDDLSYVFLGNTLIAMSFLPLCDGNRRSTAIVINSNFRLSKQLLEWCTSTRRDSSIRAALERAGTPIGPYDVLVAAQARRRDALLVTANQREFARVPD
jgi:hypothetical protein